MPSGPERTRHELVEEARRRLALDWEQATAQARDEALAIIDCHGRTGQMVAEVASNIVARVDAFQAAGSEVVAGVPPEPIACHAGYPWCCYLHVDATAPEVFRIVEYIRGAFSEGEQTALRERVAAVYEKSKGLDPMQADCARFPALSSSTNAVQSTPCDPRCAEGTRRSMPKTVSSHWLTRVK